MYFLIFGGWIMVLEYLFTGILACVSMNRYCLGSQCLRIVSHILFPYSYKVVSKDNFSFFSRLGNVFGVA
ncbi:hypothetical protein HQ29_05475 [Porphyromonas canoris]|uniref:Inner membrane component domain-containing protein n=1 Tax=Porphyromonas canoris TaxID=36875 RepID=A0ABR4XK24_9PORP|nr:hypothetical protein HQ29_05475 [Porphyromonas canoris]KGN70516.1 hypothetical protein JT26_03385 [Porphyromonas sp. COT-108 OH1349]KGN92034.1 hypothetical protein HQ43_08295 [Porphyromonas canoris]KGN96111.1 hypothetical protein HQ39_03950 [Porphyromonas sp. COT-108 OH2963]